MSNYALIGYPLAHTMSPYINRELFKLSGIQADYNAIEVAPDLLQHTFNNKLKSLNGFNVTIPYKQNIIPFLDSIDETAARYGAVNTVLCGEHVKGFNTDAYGFKKSIKTAGMSLSGRVLLCGCGGVSRTMAYECLLSGANLTLGVRESDIAVAEQLKSELLQSIENASVNVSALPTLSESFDLMINGTPLGMYPHTDKSPLSKQQLSKCGGMFDAVYNPSKTLLLKWANELSINNIGGMAMLVWQAAAAHKIWYNAEFAEADINGLISRANDEMERTFTHR